MYRAPRSSANCFYEHSSEIPDDPLDRGTENAVAGSRDSGVCRLIRSTKRRRGIRGFLEAARLAPRPSASLRSASALASLTVRGAPASPTPPRRSLRSQELEKRGVEEPAPLRGTRHGSRCEDYSKSGCPKGGVDRGTQKAPGASASGGVDQREGYSIVRNP